VHGAAFAIADRYWRNGNAKSIVVKAKALTTHVQVFYGTLCNSAIKINPSWLNSLQMCICSCSDVRPVLNLILISQGF